MTLINKIAHVLIFDKLYINYILSKTEYYSEPFTTFGQLLASEDEFGEGDGIAVVLCGLSPVVVRNEFAIV